MSYLDQKSKKKKKSKKKGNNAQASTATNTTEPQTPTEAAQLKDGAESDDSDAEETAAPDTKIDGPEEKAPDLTNGIAKTTPNENNDRDTDTDTATRFDALVKDRDALRLEVTELRKSLEELQSKHATELETVQNDLAEAQQEKETAEEQYQTLLGRVNTIRSQLGERLKADAVRLPISCPVSRYTYQCTLSVLTTGLTGSLTGRTLPSTHAHRRTRIPKCNPPRTLRLSDCRSRRAFLPQRHP